MTVQHVTVKSPKIRTPLTFAVASDLHNGPFEEAMPHIAQADAVLIPGDLVDRHHAGYANAVAFLNRVGSMKPTFYALGNHEKKYPWLAEYWPLVEKSPVTVLDNRYMLFEGMVLGGLSSHAMGGADGSFLPAMAREEGFKLLMCHHPEMFRPYVEKHDIDLTLAGHAHGGQVRIGKQGLYAPGQGILPKLTSGFYYNNRLLVSRGMHNATWAPRINNTCELIMLHLTGEK